MKYDFTEILHVAGARHNESMFNKGDLTEQEEQARKEILSLLGIDLDEIQGMLDYFSYHNKNLTKEQWYKIEDTLTKIIKGGD